MSVAGIGLLGLFTLTAAQAMDAARLRGGTVTEDVVGETLLGTAAFAALLLGAIVAVFLTHSAVRGDAEQGLLQPLLVRPVPRTAILTGRFAAGAAIAGTWTLGLWLAAVALMRIAGEWTAPAIVEPALALSCAVVLVAVASTAASTVFGPATAGITMLALLAVGFTVGVVDQLGGTLGLTDLRRVADVVSLLLPFEGLYRHVLATLQGGLGDLTTIGVATGPFGGARTAPGWTPVWIAGWGAAVSAVAWWRTRCTDF